MASLPRSYVKVVRGITGMWGAFPLSQELAPGMIGRQDEGTFRRDAWLRDLPGYDPARHAAPQPAEKASTDAWVGSGTQLEQVGVGAGGGALPVGGKFRVSFSGADEGAVVVRGSREWGFANPRLVKQHVIELYQQDQWDPRDILIMSVLLVDAAWVLVSSDRGQSVELSLEGIPAPAGAAELLKLALGSGQVDLAHGMTASVGYSGSIPDGGSPLFSAIRLRRFPRTETRYVKGGDRAFSEPEFGSPDPEDPGPETA
jgi:hypothetical protein